MYAFDFLLSFFLKYTHHSCVVLIFYSEVVFTYCSCVTSLHLFYYSCIAPYILCCTHIPVSIYYNHLLFIFCIYFLFLSALVRCSYIIFTYYLCLALLGYSYVIFILRLSINYVAWSLLYLFFFLTYIKFKPSRQSTSL